MILIIDNLKILKFALVFGIIIYTIWKKFFKGKTLNPIKLATEKTDDKMDINFETKEEYLKYLKNDFLEKINKFKWKEKNKILSLLKLGVVFIDAEAKTRTLEESKMGEQADFMFLWEL